MGFQIIMLLCSLMLPLLMLGIGTWFHLSPPDDINPICGYRTSMSMKNPLTWSFAQKYVGRLWMIFGIVLVAPTILCMILIPDGTEDSVGVVTLVVMAVQCAVMFATIFATETALRKNFDGDGNPRR